MTTDLEASLTSMDWLPRLSMTAAGLNFSPNSQSSLSSDTNPIKKRESAAATEVKGFDYKNDPTAKPSHSYAHLITMAIKSSEDKKMSLSDIYQWISDNFAFYRHCNTGWKVRILRLILRGR